MFPSWARDKGITPATFKSFAETIGEPNQSTGTLVERPVLSSDHDGHIYELRILSMPLKTSLSPRISSLTSLTHIWIEDCQLYGPIPDTLGYLVNLVRIDWSRNSLSGLLPSSLKYLVNLKHLDLSNNALEGPIDVLWHLKRLMFLNLSSNRFRGTLSEELGGLTQLVGLDLEGNLFEGKLPKSIGLLVNLKTLDLSNNHLLSGPVPPE
eukprot:jgi/Hompol1/4721/HPOL_003849-RA